MKISYILFVLIFLALLGVTLYLSQTPEKPPKQPQTITMVGNYSQEYEADRCQIKFRVEGIAKECEDANLAFAQGLLDVSEALTEKRITNKMLTRSKKRTYQQEFVIESKQPNHPQQQQVKPKEKKYVIEQDFEINLELQEAAPPAIVVATLTSHGARVLSVKFPFSDDFRRETENECLKQAVEDARQKVIRLLDGKEPTKQLSVHPLVLSVDDKESKNLALGGDEEKPSDKVDYRTHVLIPNVLYVHCKVRVVYLI